MLHKLSITFALEPSSYNESFLIQMSRIFIMNYITQCMQC